MKNRWPFIAALSLICFLLVSVPGFPVEPEKPHGELSSGDVLTATWLMDTINTLYAWCQAHGSNSALHNATAGADLASITGLLNADIATLTDHLLNHPSGSGTTDLTNYLRNDQDGTLDGILTFAYDVGVNHGIDGEYEGTEGTEVREVLRINKANGTLSIGDTTEIVPTELYGEGDLTYNGGIVYTEDNFTGEQYVNGFHEGKASASEVVYSYITPNTITFSQAMVDGYCNAALLTATTNTAVFSIQHDNTFWATDVGTLTIDAGERRGYFTWAFTGTETYSLPYNQCLTVKLASAVDPTASGLAVTIRVK